MPFCLSHARLGVYAKDGLPLGTISMNPLGGVFCRRGTAKSVEQGASYSEGLHALSAGFWPSTQHTPYSPAIRMAFRPSVRRLRKKHPVGCLPQNRSLPELNLIAVRFEAIAVYHSHLIRCRRHTSGSFVNVSAGIRIVVFLRIGLQVY